MIFWTQWICLLLIATAAAESHYLEVGTTYNYQYETLAVLNEPEASLVSSLKDVGFKIELSTAITPIWSSPKDEGEQIIQISTASSNLSVKARQGPAPEGFVSKNSRLKNYADHSLYVHWRHGTVVKVYSVKDDTLSMVNIKKGIASLLQYDRSNKQKRETDASGNCKVTYKVEKDKLIKTKLDCRAVTDTSYHNSTNKVLGANIKHTSSVTYEFSPDKKVLSSVNGLETHFLRIEARLDTGSEVMSRQKLSLKDQKKTTTKYVGKNVQEVIKSVEKKMKKKLQGESLATVPDPKECISCKSLQDLIFNFKNALSSKSLATQSSGIAFIRILQKMRESDQPTIQSILSNKKLSKILPQVLDIVAAAQTVESNKAAMAVLNFKEENEIDLQERYLLALSLSTHPPDTIILDLLKLMSSKIPNKKLQETVLLTTASLTHTYQMSGGSNKKVLEEVSKHIQTKLDKCTKEECKLKYIRALKNLREKKFVPTLLKLAAGKDRKPAIYAMRALQTMPSSFIDKGVTGKLERIFLEQDKQHDSTVRSLAINVLLNNEPSEDFLRTALGGLASLESKELNTLIISQIRDVISRNSQTRQKVSNILKDSRYNNYHILGQNGLSTAFSRTLAQDKTSNSSFTNILEISGGLLKRSTVDVFVHSQDANMSLLSFEIFAGGLNMFGGDENAAEDSEAEEATAGIEITLMNTQLRPYVFFTGQGELMGHVWAGTGSERTTALQGSVLLQDHKQYVPLQNGLNIEMVLTGVVSYDFAGQVEISLWNRNAHSLVEVAAAVVVQGQARIDNSVVQTMIEFNSGAQSQLNFVSDLDFSDDITMCLQMIQPDFEIIENVRKLERIPGSKYMLRKYKKKVIPSAGKTYVMNRKNTQLCNKMFR